MAGAQNSSRARWTGWLMAAAGFFLLLGFLVFSVLLGSLGMDVHPRWVAAIPIVLAVGLIARGVVWIARAKRGNR